jgi:hypothetical protein
MIVSVHQPQYIPWLGYFDKIAKSDCFVFLDCVQYKAREFQNRNKIRTKVGWIWLSVPVESTDAGCAQARSGASDCAGNRQKINEVKVDNGSSWQRKHAASLRAWYGGARCFNEHFPFFEEVYSRQWARLVELNVHIIQYMLKALAIDTPLVFESDLHIFGTRTQRIIEICRTLKADTYLSGIGGKEYLEEGLFAENGMRLLYQEFKHPEYEQRFMPFAAYMSAVDLLFNHGKDSREILLGKPAKA